MKHVERYFIYICNISVVIVGSVSKEYRGYLNPNMRLTHVI